MPTPADATPPEPSGAEGPLNAAPPNPAPPNPAQPYPAQPYPAPTAVPRILSSEELLQGAREVWIEHGAEMYRLRLTRNERLYLSK